MEQDKVSQGEKVAGDNIYIKLSLCDGFSRNHTG